MATVKGVKYNQLKKKSKSKVKVGKFLSSGTRFSRGNLAALVLVFAAIGGYVLYRSFAAVPVFRAAVNSPVVAITRGSSDNGGYWLTGSDGGVFSEGDAQFHNSIPGLHYPTQGNDIVGMAASTSYGGYWILEADGNVWDLYTPGGNPSIPISSVGPAVAITAAGNGYWVATQQGYTYSGTGSNTPPPIPGGNPKAPTPYPIVGIAATPDGSGYWLVNSHGQVYAYGDAKSSGNAPSSVTNIVAIVSNGQSDSGYWLIGSDGGVFAFGGAPYLGTMSGTPLNGAIVGAASTTDGQGYWLTGSDGGVFAFGDAKYLGAVSYTPPAAPAPTPPPTTTQSSTSPTAPKTSSTSSTSSTSTPSLTTAQATTLRNTLAQQLGNLTSAPSASPSLTPAQVQYIEATLANEAAAAKSPESILAGLKAFSSNSVISPLTTKPAATKKLPSGALIFATCKPPTINYGFGPSIISTPSCN